MKAATFHKTTSAKKISTNEFRHGAELEELLGGGGGAARSLKYESIVTLAQQQQQTNQNTASGHVTQYSSLIGQQQQQQSPGENTSPGSELLHHPAPDKLVGTPLQPSPYVYRHRQVG